MIGFQYYNPAKIVFGPGAIQNLERLLREAGARSLLLVYSGDFIKELGIYEAVQEACRALHIDVLEEGGVVPNPSIVLVRELVERSREAGVDFILAAGGGSAIDTAKATALGVPCDGDVWDFFEHGAVPDRVLPVGVISTISSSGSETSNCAILSNGKKKLGFEDDRIIPQFAIMDPDYTRSLPDYQRACGVADILSHLLERYFSDVPHTDVTDYLLEGAIRALLINGRRITRNPDDADARAEVQWLASVAHNNFLETGRIPDWGSHRIEHELSAEYGLTHGEGMAVVLTAWTKYAAERKPEKLAQLAVRVFGADASTADRKELAYQLSDDLAAFFRELHLCTTLRELGITSGQFAEMASRATRQGTAPVGHYLLLNEAEILEILQLAEPAGADDLTIESE